MPGHAMCRILFACSGNEVRVVSIQTGLVVRTLSAHTDITTAVVVNPATPLQVRPAPVPPGQRAQPPLTDVQG